MKYINEVMVSASSVFSPRENFTVVKEGFAPIEQNEPIVREDFCGACLALPLAFAGAGTATATAGGEEGGKKSNIFFWSVVLSVLGLVATIWFMSGSCKSCVSSPKGSVKGSICSTRSSRR
jgi:hypothetical protein